MKRLKQLSPLVRILDIGYSAKQELAKDQHKMKQSARSKLDTEINDFSEYLKKACASYTKALNLTYNKYNYLDEGNNNEPNL